MGSAKERIARNLQQYRKMKGLTQKQLAEAVGVRDTAVSSWESGINSINADYLHSICTCLDISVSDLFGGEDIRYAFGARLKKYREAKGLTQKEFAALIDVGNSRVSNWELGISRPDVDFLPIICEVLEISASELLDIKKESPTPEGAGENKNVVRIIGRDGSYREYKDASDEEYIAFMAMLDAMCTNKPPDPRL